MAKQITLREYEFLHSKDDKDENYVKNLNDLENFVLKNEGSYEYLKITHKKGFGKVLQAQNFIGVIQLKDGTTIEILPKIADLNDDKDIRNIVIKMLRTLKDSPFKNIDMANLKNTKMPLLEIFIQMFLVELAKLVQRGIKNDYVDKEENLAFLKGKLKFNEHLKQNYIHKERFFVAYQEYMADRVENRLIKTTLEYLYKKSKSSTNQQRIREFLFVFDEISISQNPKSDFEKVKINRQMRDYEQVLLWCKTFLFGNSFSPYKGDDVAFALLYDMNLLFESYVGSYIKKHCICDVSLQDRGQYLAYQKEKGVFGLKPDIVIDGGKIIVDTKWKLLDEDKNHQGVAQGDMYQMYAYGTKYNGCEKLFLIYPKSKKEISDEKYDFKIEPPYLPLFTIFFDLIGDRFIGQISS